MVRVPTTQGPTVDPRPTPFVPQSSAGATPDAFGAAQGRATEASGRELMRAASGFGDILIQQQEDDNRRQATNLENQFTERLRTLGYGDGTAENPGFYGTYGENALAAQKGVREQAAKARDELMATAPNAKVREIFGLRSGARLTSEYEQFDRHLLRERNKANDETGMARVKEAHADAVANRNNGEILNRSLDIVEHEAVAAGRRNGWSPEAVKARIREGQSLVLKDVIASTATEDPQRALALYTLHKGKIAGQHYDDIERMLKGGMTLRMAQDVTNEILAQGGTHKQMIDKVRTGTWAAEVKEAVMQQISRYMGVVHSEAVEARAARAEKRAEESAARVERKEQAEQKGFALAREFIDRRKSAADMNDFLRGIDDVDVVKEVEKLLVLHFQNQERAKGIEKRDAQLEAQQWVDSGKAVIDLPANIRAQLDGTTIAALERIEARRSLGTPWATDYQFYTSTLYYTPDQLRDANLIEARTKLADAEFTEFKRRVIQAHQGRFDENLPGSVKSLYNAHVTQLFGEHAKWKDNKETVQAVADGEQRVRAEIAKAEAANKGKKLTEEEVQGIISRVVDPFALKRAEKKWFGSEAEQNRILDATRVPSTHARAITEAFRAQNGRDPTPREIAAAFLRYQSK